VRGNVDVCLVDASIRSGLLLRGRSVLSITNVLRKRLTFINWSFTGMSTEDKSVTISVVLSRGTAEVEVTPQQGFESDQKRNVPAQPRLTCCTRSVAPSCDSQCAHHSWNAYLWVAAGGAGPRLICVLMDDRFWRGMIYSLVRDYDNRPNSVRDWKISCSTFDMTGLHTITCAIQQHQQRQNSICIVHEGEETRCAYRRASA